MGLVFQFAANGEKFVQKNTWKSPGIPWAEFCRHPVKEIDKLEH